MASPEMHRYTRLTLIATCALLAMALMTTYLVDPYSIHGRDRVPGFNAKKPFAYTHTRTAKTQLARESGARMLFLGNSRMDAGFSPGSPVIPSGSRPAFNFGIPGQSLLGDLKNVSAVPELDTVKHVIIGVDFADFTFDGTDPARSRSPDSEPSRFRQFTTLNLSLTAISDALLTIWKQRGQFTNSMTALGANTFAEHLGHVRLEGHFGLFHQRNIENARAFLRRPRQVRTSDGRVSRDFDALDQLIDWGQQRGARVDLLIYPYHAQLMDLLDHTGHWSAYEDWKQLLVQRVAHRKNVVLWDFSGFNEVTTETVPPKGDTRTDMVWYWEAGHFKNALGDLMLRRMLGEEPVPAIGVRLDENSLGRTLDRIREERASWRKEHPDDARYVKSLVKPTG